MTNCRGIILLCKYKILANRYLVIALEMLQANNTMHQEYF